MLCAPVTQSAASSFERQVAPRAESMAEDDDDEAAFAQRANAQVEAEARAKGPGGAAPFPGVEEEGAPQPEANAEGVAQDPARQLLDTIGQVREAFSQKKTSRPLALLNWETICTCRAWSFSFSFLFVCAFDASTSIFLKFS